METIKDWKAFKLNEEIDTKSFNTTVDIFCFVTPIKSIKSLLPEIGDFMFNKKGIKNIIDNADDKLSKLILMSETVSETNMPQK